MIHTAIERKAGLPVTMMTAEQARAWQNALAAFVRKLTAAPFDAYLFDYDGTCTDDAGRGAKPNPLLAVRLAELAESGARLAFATGRGGSAGEHLREILPPETWDATLIGYYNGGCITTLRDVLPPDDRQSAVHPRIEALAGILQKAQTLWPGLRVKQRARIISLFLADAGHDSSPELLWELAQETVAASGLDGVTIFRSGRTVDIVPEGVSKKNVMDKIAPPGSRVMVVGDQGHFSGNDHELLRAPLALSVDKVSRDPAACWNLAPKGCRGSLATARYLSEGYFARHFGAVLRP